LYCIKCDDDEPSNHDHKGKFIVAKGDSIKKEWRQIREDIQNTASKVKDWWTNQGPLVELLATDNRKLIDDYHKVCELQTSVTQFYQQKVAEKEQSDNVVDL
jgi:hypothetical protein